MGPEVLGNVLSPQAIAYAREQLSSLNRMNASIALRLSQLEQLRSRQNRLDQCLSHRNADARQQAGDVLQTLEAQLLSDYHQLLEKRRQLQELLAAIPDDRHRMVLEMRYLEGMPFFRIAMALHYDERQIYRFHEKGLRQAALRLALDAKKD